MTASTAKSPAELLRAGADYIAEHGLRKDDWGVAGGACCAWGTLNLIDSGQPDPSYLHAALVRDAQWLDDGDASAVVHDARVALEMSLNEPVSQWNDTRGVGAKTVIAKMRSVADRLDAGETQ